jgi:pyruvate formate-lyase/glycerol dehydratase family glycyl radical enzyme
MNNGDRLSFERTQKLRQWIRDAVPEVCTERARLVTESYRETEQEPIAIRRGKAIKKILQNISIRIYDDELIVGNYAGTPRGAPIFPETTGGWVGKELDTFWTRSVDRVKIDDEKIAFLRKEVLPYWERKTVQTYAHGYIPEDTKKAWRIDYPVFTAENYLRSSIGHLIPGSRVVLEKGFDGIIDQAKCKAQSLDLSDPASLEKKVFYQSVIIACEGASAFARRFSRLASEMAKKEASPKRKAELLEIAAVCDRVPAKPARSFREALQCFWFEQLMLQLELEEWALSTERFDNLMFPYYQNDVRSGALTRAKAQELVECLWIKFFEILRAYDTLNATYFSGFSIGQILTIGGVDENGRDDTNELSFICMDAEDNMRLTQPNLAVRLNKNTPDEFLYRVCEYIAQGTGKPSLFNDEAHIPALLRDGVALKDARNYGLVGCVEPTPAGNCFGWTNGAMFNLAKCLELALNNGKCRLSGQQAGPETGDPRDFRSFDELVAAYNEQIAFFVKHMVIVDNAIDITHQLILPAPLLSATVDDCLEKGKDVVRGGARYNYVGPQGVGLADVADSLAALKKHIFERKTLSMDEVLKALDSDFAGAEKTRRVLQDSPRYGNDDDYVDEIAVKVGKQYCEEVARYTNARGGKYRPGLYPVSANVPMGMDVGALPSGRQAREPLADGVSPEAGADRKGPTSVINSVSKLDHLIASNGTLLNQKFSPAVLSGRENLIKFAELIKTYFELGGMHIQFNVVSAETLREAQKLPEKYKNLLVRVAGYSAFFVDLDKSLQENIIARTEHTRI